jgi:hypothetical protein
MGLLDKLKGSKPAKPGAAPVGVEDRRSALLGFNRATAPWQVRDGAEDGCDLVAEWRIVDAEWQGIFFQYGLEKVFRVKLKFDEDAHEVRNVDEQATVTWRDGIPSVSKSWSRGQINDIQSGTALGFTEQGEFGEVYNYTFRSREIKNPLRDAVTEHGWGWKAVSFKL